MDASMVVRSRPFGNEEFRPARDVARARRIWLVAGGGVRGRRCLRRVARLRPAGCGGLRAAAGERRLAGRNDRDQHEGSEGRSEAHSNQGTAESRARFIERGPRHDRGPRHGQTERSFRADWLGPRRYLRCRSTDRTRHRTTAGHLYGRLPRIASKADCSVALTKYRTSPTA